MKSELSKYDTAKRALAEARAVDEVKDILDKAEAMRVYALRAEDTQLFADASEIKDRAIRRLGEIIDEQKKTVGLNAGTAGKGRPKLGAPQRVAPNIIPTLASVGISHNLSSRAQKVAQIPKAQFEAALVVHRKEMLAKADKFSTDVIKKARKVDKKNVHEFSTLDGCTVDSLDGLISSGRKFGTIYADPPWLYDNQGTRASTDNHYSGLTIEQLCALPIEELAADDAHLHLWTTNGFLFECPKLFEAWGFEFRSSFIWVKPQMGIGNYWRNSHEIMLTAIRGNAKRFNEGAKNLKSWIECDRGRHSAKPEQVRHFIEKASDGPRLELFGRSSAPGWVVWGNQIEKTIFDSAVAGVA